jgi:hypothetical protein
MRIEKESITETKYVIHFDHTKSGRGLLRKRKAGRTEV